MDNPLDPKALKADLGGKPVWFWGLIGGVFVLALYYVFKSKKAATIAGSMATGQGSVTDTLNNAFPTVDLSTPGGVSTTTNNALGDASLETKESWTGRAVVIGAREGHSSIFMTNAINKYFTGIPLTQAEAGAINSVIAQIGLPPGGQALIVKLIKPVVTPEKTNTSVNDTKKKNPVAPVTPAKPKVTPVKPKATPKAKPPVIGIPSTRPNNPVLQDTLDKIG